MGGWINPCLKDCNVQIKKEEDLLSEEKLMHKETQDTRFSNFFVIYKFHWKVAESPLHTMHFLHGLLGFGAHFLIAVSNP